MSTVEFLSIPKLPIHFDIETTGLSEAELRSAMPEFKAPANWKDQDKIDACIASQQIAWFEEAALHATRGRVLAIGLMQGDQFTVLDGESPRNEGDMLAEFWLHWNVIGSPRFVGFAIRYFDLPFLMRRSWKLGVPVPWDVKPGRYFHDRFTDLQDVWTCGSNKPEERTSLGALAQYLGVGAKTGTGEDFGRLWRHDRPAAIAYLKNDLILTASCAKKMGVV